MKIKTANYEPILSFCSGAGTVSSRLRKSPIVNPVIKSVFCGVDTVSCISGLPVNQVYDKVDSGGYLWVWNVSTGVGAKRELRFWSREINNPASVANLTLDAVINAIIPDRTHIPGQHDGLRNWELRHLLRLSKSTLSEMRQELGIRGTAQGSPIPRASLELFFRRRWLGNINIPGGTLQFGPTL